MFRTFAIGGFAAAALLLGTAAQAQRIPGMPGKKACERGMPHQVCVARCVALGGTGRGPPNPVCSHRCSRMGCQEGGARRRPH